MIATKAALLLVQRNAMHWRRQWWVLAAGFLEPVLYLLSIGVGVGGMVSGFTYNGHPIAYATFVAPGMLATSAMNGAMYDGTMNFFFKLHYDKWYQAVLATPLRAIDVARGELMWTLARGSIYGISFIGVMLAMGLIGSWWALLAPLAVILVGSAFAALFMSVTTYLKTMQDLDYVTLVQLPLFLFSATFFPITTVPDWLRWILECTPLYRAVVLMRDLCTGVMDWGAAVSVVYMIAMTAIGLTVIQRRITKLILS